MQFIVATQRLLISYTAQPRHNKALVGTEFETIDGAPFSFSLTLNVASTFQVVQNLNDSSILLWIQDFKQYIFKYLGNQSIAIHIQFLENQNNKTHFQPHCFNCHDHCGLIQTLYLLSPFGVIQLGLRRVCKKWFREMMKLFRCR